MTLGGHVFLTSLNLVLFLAGYNILPVEFYRFPVDLKDTVDKQREDAWMKRDSDDPDKVFRFVLDDLGTPPYRGYSSDDVRLYYTNNKLNVFTAEAFSLMQDIEEQIFNNEMYQEKHCQLTELRQCTKPRSVLRYFDGTYTNIDPVFYDPEFERVNEVIYNAYTNPQTAEDFKYFLGKDAIITDTEVFNNLTRAAFPMGYPLDNNSSKSDYNIIKDFCADYFIPEIDNALEVTKGQALDVVYVSFIIFDVYIMGDVFKDMALAIGSISFIIIFMRVVTKSFWITLWAVMSIISCFFITNLIYRIILDYIYFGYFHVIAIFIILGIGADDFFVYFNAWEANCGKEYPSMAHRLSDTFRVAAGTMFFTSFTTMMAFFAGGLSPILAMGSFGIFTGVLIAVNYISVIIFFPTVVYTHHVFYKGIKCCGCKQNVEYDSSDETVLKIQKADSAINGGIKVDPIQVAIFSEKPNQSDDARPQERLANGTASTICPVNGVAEIRSAGTVHEQELNRQKDNIVTVFFRGPYFRFITHKYVRWVMICGLLSFVGFCGYSLTNLEVDAEEVGGKDFYWYSFQCFVSNEKT